MKKYFVTDNYSFSTVRILTRSGAEKLRKRGYTVTLV